MADLQSLSTPLALWRLLALKGIELPFAAVEEALPTHPGVDDLLSAWRHHGFDARQVNLALEDVNLLETPSLLPLLDGGWLILHGVKKGAVNVEPGPAGPPAWIPLEALQPHWAGRALDIGDSLAIQGGIWKRMWALVPRYRREWTEAFATALALQGLAMLTPWIMAVAVDRALPQAAPSLLTLLTWGLIATALFRAWAGWLRELSLQAFSVRWEAALTKGLFSHVLALPFRNLQKRSLGEFLQAFSGLQQARNQVMNRGLSALLTGFTAIGYLGALFLLLPGSSLPWVVVALSAVLSLFQGLAGWVAARILRKEVETSETQRTALGEMLQGMAAWKATGSQEAVLTRWETPLRRGVTLALQRERWDLATEVAHELLAQGLTALVLIWGGKEVLDGHLSLGQLLAFSQLASGFLNATSGLLQTGVSLLILRPQMRILHELFSLEREPLATGRPPKELLGPVVVEDVWFRYAADAPWVLQSEALHVEPRTFHHVKGPSGSGKSTLLKILAGLYHPDQGRVSLGGLEPRAAAALIGYLPQFPQLIGGSIRENLHLLSGGVPLERLMEAADETGLGAWIATLPMGYDTFLASGGGNLSGGQRQLIAITAILASEKQVLLLDEALSNLDWLSRRRILESPRFRGRTLIYASHEEVWKD